MSMQGGETGFLVEDAMLSDGHMFQPVKLVRRPVLSDALENLMATLNS